MGNYPYPSSYIVNGAQPPLPAFPVRAACAHLADAALPDDSPALLGALASAVGVFYNHTGDQRCLSFKEGPNPETGGFWLLGWGAVGLLWGPLCVPACSKHERACALTLTRVLPPCLLLLFSSYSFSRRRGQRLLGLPVLHGAGTSIKVCYCKGRAASIVPFRTPDSLLFRSLLHLAHTHTTTTRSSCPSPRTACATCEEQRGGAGQAGWVPRCDCSGGRLGCRLRQLLSSPASCAQVLARGLEAS